jgi:hypothetical protein
MLQSAGYTDITGGVGRQGLNDGLLGNAAVVDVER